VKFPACSEREEPEIESPNDEQSLYEAHLEQIEEVLRRVGLRRCLSGDEGEDFTSWARLRLLENDCAILRKFKARSSFRTYLVTVVQNLFRDYRIAKWGKFRPSAQANRLGTTAVRLEILLYRDGIPFDEAAELLRRNHGVEESVGELAGLAGDLPVRIPNRAVGEEVLETVGDPGEVEDRVRDQERTELAAKVTEALDEALETLTPEDRLILRMRFQDGLTVAAISRTLGLEQKPLYRRIGGRLREVRRALEEAGVRAEDVSELSGWDDRTLRVESERAAETGASSPSQGRRLS